MSEQILETNQAAATTNTSTPSASTSADTAPKATETTQTTTQTSLSKPSTESHITKAEEAPPAETPPAEVTPPAKPDYTDMITGFIEGDLTEEDYVAIEKSGLSRQDFTVMAEGYKALQEKHTQELYGFAGGEESYRELQQFGAHNLTEGQIAQYNAALDTGDPTLAKIAVLGLKALMQEKKGNNPSERVEAGASTGSTADIFTSSEDVIRAMRDPRYKTDPAYRTEVDAKRSRSAY